MLTSSPLAPRSMSASPHTFHYAPHGLSPHLSPKVTANLPRRQSKHSVVPFQTAPLGSLKSPSQSQLLQQNKSKQYVGVDAATQYSPMEPFDPTVPMQNARPPAPPEAHLPSSTTTAAKSVVAHTSTPATSTALQSLSTTPQAPSEPNLSPKRPDNAHSAENTLSPAKRRNSQDLANVASGADMDGAAAASSDGQAKTSPKRSRVDQPPDKVLPLRYELCDVEDMVILIANMLSELIETNDSLAMKSGHLTRFHSR